MEQTVKERWQKLVNKRQVKLERGRICSAITIPTILPPKGFSQAEDQRQNYSSIQSRGITSLASKILSALLPLNDTPFFGFGLKDGSELTGEIGYYLSTLTNQVYRKLMLNNLREATYLAIQHLIVVGDVMILMEDDISFRVFSLDRFVIRRDTNGTILEVIYTEFIAHKNEEKIDPSNFSAEEEGQSGYTTMYVRMWKDSETNEWNVEKEVKGECIDKGTFVEPPIAILRWSSISGEDYGRSHVEDVFSDIATLEKYTKANIQGMLASSTFFMAVDPSGITEVDDVATASTGDWVAGRNQDIYVISPSQTMNPQVVASSNAVEAMRREVGAAFLMHTASMPTGDRVTATAIRAIGNELETILGGTFSAIARDLFVPIIRRALYIMIKNGEVDTRLMDLANKQTGLIDVEIQTGLQALGRESDLTRLLQMGEMVRNLPPEALKMFKWSSYGTALISALGFDPKNWVKTAEEMQQEQAEQAKQMQQQEARQAAMSSIMPAAGQMASKAVEEGNIPPEAVQGISNMLGGNTSG
jgi:Bacteriophage head to tail connecting protein